MTPSRNGHRLADVMPAIERVRASTTSSRSLSVRRAASSLPEGRANRRSVRRCARARRASSTSHAPGPRRRFEEAWGSAHASFASTTSTSRNARLAATSRSPRDPSMEARSARRGMPRAQCARNDHPAAGREARGRIEEAHRSEGGGTRAASRGRMRTFGLGAALLVSVLLLLVVWIVGRAAGFSVSLWSSLGLTVLLTVILNVVLGALSRRRRRV